MANDDELTTIRAEMEVLRARLAELEARDAPPPPDAPIARRHLLRGLAGLGVAGVAGIATADAAAAADGDPLVLGEDNSASSVTRLELADGADAVTALEVVSQDTFATVIARVVDGDADTGTALRAEDATTGTVGGFAVEAVSQKGAGLRAESSSAVLPAVIATAKGAAPALAGTSTTGGPQLYLVPGEEDPDGPPTSGSHAVGEVRMDPSGDVWVCTATGAPGTWTRLVRADQLDGEPGDHGRVVPVSPFRALDTRAPGGRAAGAPAVPGQAAGRVAGGESLTLDIAGAGGVPTTATGVFGNLIVVTPGYKGNARILPSGASSPASSVNFEADTSTLANSYVCGLGPAGVTLRPSGSAAQDVHLVLDVAGYLT